MDRDDQYGSRCNGIGKQCNRDAATSSRSLMMPEPMNFASRNPVPGAAAAPAAHLAAAGARLVPAATGIDDTDHQQHHRHFDQHADHGSQRGA